MRNWFRTSQIQLPFLLFLPSFLQIDGAHMKNRRQKTGGKDSSSYDSFLLSKGLFFGYKLC